MKKLLLPFEEKTIVKEGDIIIYNGRCYTSIPKASYLKEVLEDMYNLSSKLENALKRIENLEKQGRIDRGEESEDELE